MKKYLLLAGDNYYPQSGTEDWIGIFETKEEAENRYKEFVKEQFSQNDLWYEIVDLEEWIKLNDKQRSSQKSN